MAGYYPEKRRLKDFYIRSMKCPEMALRIKEKYAKAKELPTEDERNAAKLEIKRSEIECLEQCEKELKPGETPEDRRRRQFMEIHEQINLKKKATLDEDREWARRHFFTEPWLVNFKDVPSRSSVVCLLLAMDDKVFRQKLFAVEKQSAEAKTNGQQGSDKHLRDLLGVLPFQNGDSGAAGGRGKEQGGAGGDSEPGQGSPAAG